MLAFPELAESVRSHTYRPILKPRCFGELFEANNGRSPVGTRPGTIVPIKTKQQVPLRLTPTLFRFFERSEIWFQGRRRRFQATAVLTRFDDEQSDDSVHHAWMPRRRN